MTVDVSGSRPRNAAGGIRYSVIVCTRNRAAFLRDCLGSILQNPDPAYEVVVVDQSDGGNTEEIVARQAKASSVPLRYIRDTKRGLSRAQNLGVAMANGEFLLFTHDDVLVSSNWIRSYENNLQLLGLDSRAVITGRVEPGESESGGVLAPSTKTDADRKEYQGRLKEGVLYPNNMLIHRSVFDVVGYFDENLGPGTPLPAAEDNDFCYRLLINGYSIFYVPDVVAWHRSWRTPEQMLALHYSYALGQGGFYAKYLWRLDGFLVRAFVIDVARAARGLVKAPILRGGDRWKEYWNNLTGLITGAGVMTWTMMRTSLRVAQRSAAPAQPHPPTRSAADAVVGGSKSRSIVHKSSS